MGKHRLEVAQTEVILDPRRVAFLLQEGILLLNDFHFGLTPDGKADHLSQEIVDELIQEYEPIKVIILGDYLVSPKVANFANYEAAFAEILHSISDCAELVLIEGNVDGRFAKLFPEYELHEYYQAAGFTFCHGHQPELKDRMADGEHFIVGHGHPTFRYEDHLRHCFLKHQNTLLLPTISPWSNLGNDLLTYYRKNFPSNYFYEFDWDVYLITEKVAHLGKRSSLGNIQQGEMMAV